TIKSDCELPGLPDDLSSLVPAPADRDTLIELYERYGFRTWLRELTGDDRRVPAGDARAAHEVPPVAADVRYETVTDLQALERWIERIGQAELTALDTETTSLDEMQARLVGISLAT